MIGRGLLQLLTAGFGTNLPIQDVCSTAAVGGKADESQARCDRPPGQGPPRSLELGRSAIDADSFDGTDARRQHCGEDNHD